MRLKGKSIRKLEIHDASGLRGQFIAYLDGWVQTIGRISEEALNKMQDDMVASGYCLVCGECHPGDEEWDWCDHVYGDNCAYNPDFAEEYEDVE